MNKKMSRMITILVAIMMIFASASAIQATKKAASTSKWTPSMLKARLQTAQKTTYNNLKKVIDNNKNNEDEFVSSLLMTADEVASLETWEIQCDNLIYAAKQLGSKSKTITGENSFGQNTVIRRKNDVITWAETGNRSDGSMSYGESRFIEKTGAADEYFEYQDGSRAYGSIFPTSKKGLYLSAVEMDTNGDYYVIRGYIGSDVFRMAMMMYPGDQLSDTQNNDPFPFLAQSEPKDWKTFIEEDMIELTYNQGKITINYMGENTVLK